MVSVALLVIEVDACIDMLACLQESTATPKGRPSTVIGLQQDSSIFELSRHPEEVGQNSIYPIESGLRVVIKPQVSDRGREVSRTFEQSPDPGGALDRLAHLLRRPPRKHHGSLDAD